MMNLTSGSIGSYVIYSRTSVSGSKFSFGLLFLHPFSPPRLFSSPSLRPLFHTFASALCIVIGFPPLLSTTLCLYSLGFRSLYSSPFSTPFLSPLSYMYSERLVPPTVL